MIPDLSKALPHRTRDDGVMIQEIHASADGPCATIKENRDDMYIKDSNVGYGQAVQELTKE